MVEEFKPTDAQARGYTRREVAKIEGKTEIEKQAIAELGAGFRAGLDLIKEFVKVGVSNPIVGAASAVIVANLLRRAQVIDGNAEGLVDGIAVAVVGVTLGSAIAADVTNVIDAISPFDIFKQTAAPPNDLSPTAQVVVFGDSAGEKVMRALSGQTIPEVRYIEGKGE